MCYIHPAVRALKVYFLSAFFVAHSPLAKLPWRRKLFTVFLVIRQDKVCFDTCPIQVFFIMIVDVVTILFQLKSTVIASIDLVRQRSPSDGSGRNQGIGSRFLASYLYHWKLPSELLETAVYVCINWHFFVFKGKMRCCCFRICTIQCFLMFDKITAIYLWGRCVW